MSICVAFNLSDGVVIAVDSATTLTDVSGAVSKVFMDADKLFQLGNLKVGIATYGLAALDGRTIGSFVREFALLPTNSDIGALSLGEIVERLRLFFSENYKSFAEKVHLKPFDEIPDNLKGSLGLVVGGFSAGAFQSELWEIVIPQNATANSAKQWCPAGSPGFVWFASALPITRYLKGFDPRIVHNVLTEFEGILGRILDDNERQKLMAVASEHEFNIQIAGMPIQSGIACAKFLVDFVLGHYRFAETHPIVGGKTTIGIVAYDHSAFRILE